MQVLFENPWWIIFIGIIIEAALGMALFRTGRGVLLWAMIGVLAIVLLGVLVEHLVVTETERVEMTLDGLCAALEANDLNRALTFVSPDAVKTRQRAAQAMGRIEIQAARIYYLEININRLASPWTARASFTGYFSYHDRQGEIPYNNYTAKFIVDLRKETNGWVVIGHFEEQGPGGTSRVLNEE